MVDTVVSVVAAELGRAPVYGRDFGTVSELEADLARRAVARGVPEDKAADVAKAVMVQLYRLRGGSTAYGLPKTITDIAANGVITLDEREQLKRASGSMFALANDEAELDAARARDLMRAGEAVGVRLPHVDVAVTQNAVRWYAKTSDTSAIVKLLNSEDPTQRIRGNLVAYDKMSLIADAASRARSAAAIINQLSDAQLAALEPSTAAALAIAVSRAKTAIAREPSNAVLDAAGQWTFVTTGGSDSIRDRRLWEVRGAAPVDGVLNRLIAAGPRSLTYTVADDRLTMIDYVPVAGTK